MLLNQPGASLCRRGADSADGALLLTDLQILFTNTVNAVSSLIFILMTFRGQQLSECDGALVNPELCRLKLQTVTFTGHLTLKTRVCVCV